MRQWQGTRQLIRLALRRDRIMLPAWILGISGITVITTLGLKDIYSTVEARQQLATTADTNPAFLALLGPLYDSSTIGGVLAWRWGVFGSVFVALMSMFLVTRHTRAEEESGRAELIGSAPVGRYAMLTAAAVIALIANVGVASLTSLSLISLGEAAAGSWLFGVGFGSVGMVLAAVAAVTAQLTRSARGANALAGAVLGIAYLVRSVGDATGTGGPTWLVWLSPLGWFERAKPFAGNQWTILILFIVLCGLLLVVAGVLLAHRDYDAALFPERHGPAQAGSRLNGVVGLAWRLQRGTLIGWTIGLAILGGVYGAVAIGVAQMIQANPALATTIAQLGGTGELTDIYFASIMGIIGLLATLYVIQAINRLRVEEVTGRAEIVLAEVVPRSKWIVSHYAIAIAGTVIILEAAGLGAGLAHGIRAGDISSQLGKLSGAALIQAPGVWVVAGLALALFGMSPRLIAVSWAVVAALFVIGQLGPLLNFKQWILNSSPFTHLPKLPNTTTITGTPLVWLVLLAIALTVAGLLGFRRRDVG